MICPKSIDEMAKTQIRPRSNIPAVSSFIQFGSDIPVIIFWLNIASYVTNQIIIIIIIIIINVKIYFRTSMQTVQSYLEAF